MYILLFHLQGHPLVPSLSSELGKEANELREKLDSIPIDILTYGIIYHPHLSPSGCKLAGAVQRSMKGKLGVSDR